MAMVTLTATAASSTAVLPRRRFPRSAAAVSAGGRRISTSSSFSLFLLPSSSHLPSLSSVSSHFHLFPPFPVAQPSRRRSPSRRPPPRTAVVALSQTNVLRVLQTAWRVAKDGIEAGSNLVPVSVPRPLARIGVGIVAGVVALVLLKSFLSTLFFVLAMVGLIYFTFITLNTDEVSKGGGSTSSTDEDSLEEARKIMEKYK